VLVGWQDSGRVADRNPTDRDRGLWWQIGAQVDRCVRPCFGTAPEPSTVEDRNGGRDEDFALEGGAHDMCIGPDQAVISDGTRVRARRPNDGVFHHDAIAADPNRAAVLGDNPSAI